jgi:hypothetical protein
MNDGDLIVDAGDVYATARTLPDRWRPARTDELAPATLETAARLLDLGAHHATAYANDLRRRARHARDSRPMNAADR